MTKLKLKFPQNGLSGFAERILLKLQAVECGYIMKDGKLKVGSLVAPSSVADSLLCQDMVYKRENRLVINSVGLSYIRRMKHLAKHCKKETIDQSSAYAGQHRLVGKKAISGEGGMKIHKTNLGETPLGWLLKRKGRDGKSMISMEQYLAGERLREDFEMSGISPHITLNYDAITRSNGQSFSEGAMGVADHTIAAKKRLDVAMDYVGPDLKDILVRVCCHLEGLELCEKSLGWPQRSAKVVLAIALSRLADHYNNHIG